MSEPWVLLRRKMGTCVHLRLLRLSLELVLNIMPPGNLKLFLALETCVEHQMELYCILWKFSRADEYFMLKQNVLTIAFHILFQFPQILKVFPQTNLFGNESVIPHVPVKFCCINWINSQRQLDQERTGLQIQFCVCVCVCVCVKS